MGGVLILIFEFWVGLPLALVGALAGGRVGEDLGGRVDGLAAEWAGLIVGLLLGLLLGLLIALVLGAVTGLGLGLPWFWYQLTRAGLAITGHLPWRLMTFLSDAHRIGVLRQVGPRYQFRHARLQDRLAGARGGRIAFRWPPKSDPLGNVLQRTMAAIWERMIGPDRPRTATSLDNQASAAFIVTTFGLLFCPITVPLGLYGGYRARKRIRASGVHVTNSWMATAAIVVGWLGTLLLLAVLVILIVNTAPPTTNNHP